MSTFTSMISHNRWLWWKEFRMLMPLALMLVGVALLLFVMTALMGNSYDVNSYVDDVRLLLPIAFPILFAVGCGAVLVGQEREQRTIEFMSSLPLEPRQWIAVKFAVAMLGLLAMWIFALLCLMAMDDGHGSISHWRIGGIQGMSNAPVAYPLWIVHSVYLTICGFYAAWRIRHPFHALVAVVALACLPLAISELFRYVVYVAQRHHLSGEDVRMVTTGLIALLIPIMGWLAYRSAMRILMPQTVGLAESAMPETRHGASDAVARSGNTRSFWSTAPVMGSNWSSMIWQSIRSAPLAIAIPTVLLVAAITGNLMLSEQTLSNSRVIFGTLILVSPIAVSWLGVLVFQNDGSAERIRFLADRGVSPTKAYFARHAIPFAILCGCLCLYSLLALRRTFAAPGDPMQLTIPSLLTVGFAAWVIYSTSQWTSQLFRTLILSAIVGPVVSLMVLGWFVWSIGALETPLWLVAICSLAPMLATWWSMRRYMDMRDRPSSTLAALGVAVVLIGVPVGAATMRVRQIPDMASATRTNLLDEAEKIRRSAFSPIVLSLSKGNDAVFRRTDRSEMLPIDQVEQWLKTRHPTPQQMIPALADVRQHPELAASADKFAFFNLFNTLMYQRLTYESDPESKASWQAFSPWLVAASEIAQSLRNSTQWKDQETADMLEIWIADTLGVPGMDAWKDDPSYQSTVAHLPTSAKRNAARRSAVLATWARYLAKRDNSLDQGLSYQPAYLATWMRSRRADAIVETALAGLRSHDQSDSKSSGDASDAWLRQMHHLQMMPTMPFDFGPYAPRIRSRPAIELIRSGSTYPAEFWGMPWETTIDQLIQENVQ
ncbi:ABC-2 family transporter protein [Rubripirellula lacrimiformis]|uniref:ABC-2 family transporter protein n=1 Tax=Rubripirellula lacrimiformis TaxID=1930273 RepID=A0A517NJF0_9BACT|nr:hypothetical protein [Rubripirellula lacrimiformis]QDT07143.1 ABC-2 family transporter protein [Rubripirellula lacrimiformis]